MESPAQLLNAAEWAAATPDSQVDIVVLAPRRNETRRQLRATAALLHTPETRIIWCEARQGVRGPLRIAGRVVPSVRAAGRLVLGDPFSGLMQSVLPFFGGSSLVVVDDGTATLEAVDRLELGEPLLRWHQVRRGPVQRARGQTATRLLTSRPLELFTAMPVDSTRLWVRHNRYDWLRSRWPRPQLRPGAALIGTSLVETKVVRPDAYLQAVADLVAGGGLTRYLAHRREDEQKLATISALGVSVERPLLPLEIELGRGPVEQRVLSFPSTVLYTLPLVLAGAGVDVQALDVEEAWLTDDARQHGASDFLQRVRDHRA
ncbi:hypothetical protein DT076_01260 [Desertihabitans brevis]|uniref:Uncharacterized protein n=1 Tax=Desertihabitans brevis TaxID=2268447 RepID=A0A367YYY4_9ACTN|nr:hypothetical protein [Desertihabitans brevis]RCK71125.1 hypothetical protein DT076_01260 [Desertihabitans brevis]